MRFVFACVLVGAIARGALAAAGSASTLEIWVRPPGSVAAAQSRGAVELVDVDRDISLRALIAAHAPAVNLDIALLHFANGMTVPLPFRDERVMARLDPSIVRAASARHEAPLRLVVKERWHPDVGPRAAATFTPWQYVDELVGIELVEGRAYYAQLDVAGAADVRDGGRLFRESCQFCHAARGVGGNLGWDFIEPEPIYSDGWFRHFRSTSDDIAGYSDPATSLYAHATFRIPGTAGRLMPALRHLTPADARSLWLWIRAVAARPTPPYAPSR